MTTIATLVVDVETRTRRFTAGLKTITGGLAVLGAAAAYSFKQFEDSEKVMAQTDAVLKSTGEAANVTAGQVNSLADALSRKTGIDDETIQSGENVLLTFKNISNEAGKGNDIFTQSTKAITDLSVAMGQDFKSSAVQVGKALNDPVAGMTALQRVGVTFSDEQKKQIEQFVKHNNLLGAQKIILRELSSEFGGSAEAQKTASQTMATALGNLAEVVGGLLAPAITTLAEGLQVVIDFLQKNLPEAFKAAVDWFKQLWERIRPVAEVIAAILWPALQAAWHAIQDHLVPALARLWEAFGPILKVLGLAALAFGVVIVGQVLLLITVISQLIDWFSKLVDWVREHLAEPIVHAIETVINFLRHVIDILKGPALVAWSIMKDGAITVLRAIEGVLDTLIGKVTTLLENLGRAAVQAGVFNDINLLGPGTGGGPSHGGGPHPPHAASGGFVAQAGLAVIHKGENIIPAGAGGVTVNVNGWVGSDTQLARKIRDELNKLGDRNAGSGVR